MTNIIFTDCFGTKSEALESGCIIAFEGKENFSIKQLPYEGASADAPKSLEELAYEARRRIRTLVIKSCQLDFTEDERNSQKYFATLRKGFFQIGDVWFFVCMALFGKSEDEMVTIMSHAVPLKKAVWESMNLSDMKRYQKFSEVYDMFSKKPLIECIEPTLEVEFFKEAFKPSIFLGK